MAGIILSQITVYPVKSLAGINVPSWPVTATGLRYDRQWMLIDATGQFLSQRRLAAMALIKTALTDRHLILSAPGKTDLHLPVSPALGITVACTIWEDQCTARHVSTDADEWLSDFLQQECRLVYLPEDEIRTVDPDYAKASDQTAFSDGFPFLLVSENSLACLNEAMQLAMSMARFRPNLVVSGCAGYAEDSWREIRIGAIDFRLPKPCSRCSVPTVDPNTAQTGKEPLTTLNRTRKWQNKVYFGQNALHNQTGSLAVGDVVTVTRSGDKQPPI
ncbi:MAG: MOSC domain-containing protein [Methylovulum sp.]|uniref:MOSC domain-containing protein n=1 Tax=Methylovulum sp. TaxID=1916980 RepID=UPI00260DF3B7|nr:MOSC N-terminal beta barrel domain-containing protein [Methylovulum sp.]MDD2724053.1 MOSC domain-containing protein [Methylovulum sp.]MDD5123841.1 MOSC domain-containing protein [Methylovulum sp.]